MSSLTVPLLIKLLSILFATYIFLHKLALLRRPAKGIPLPGPAALPIIGNALQFPTTTPWKQLKTWSDKYGPIYQISALGKTFVVLGSEEVANDLLRARGGIYSDRHYIAVLREQLHLPIVRYGDTWRRQRKFFHFAQLQSHAHNPHYIAALTRNIHRTVDELLAAYSTTTKSDSFSSPPYSFPSESPFAPATSSIADPDRNSDPEPGCHWHRILEAYICGTVSQLAYGHIVTSATDKYVRDWVGFYNEFEKAAEPARYAVNVFPWLRLVPFGPWRTSGKAYLDREREMICGMFFGVKERVEAEGIGKKEKGVVGADDREGKAETESMVGDGSKKADQEPWSIARLYWSDPDKWSTASPSTNLTAEEAAYTLGAFIEASMAGTPAALKLFFQAMLWYPEWQDRIYEQICEVCGDTSTSTSTSTSTESSTTGAKEPSRRRESSGRDRPRMPTLHDSPKLPIIRAVIKEMLRWRPTLPGGFPHRLISDDLYHHHHHHDTNPTTPSPPSTTTPPHPYLLKKSTLLLWHHWTISRNRQTYPDPETFNPTRFLDAHTYPQTAKLPLSRFPTCQFDASFGFGRRMCPGTQQAEDMMFLAVAWIVVACRIERKRKRKGKSEPRAGKGEEEEDALERDFESVPWYEYDEGRPTRPKAFDFVLVEREGWRDRLGVYF